MIEFGHLAAFFAFGLSLAQWIVGWRGERKLAAQLACAAFVLMAISFLTLIRAFLISDFSVELVASNSHTLKPMIFKFAGTWGNHEGSMALWCLVTLGFGAAGAVFMKTGRPKTEARTLGFQGLIAVGSLAYLLFASSPFERLDPAPLQGASLNPLLQDFALALHPPMLYFGYVGYSFLFAFAAAGLWERRIDRVWAKEARRWGLYAFIPLTLGIALGSYWAYYELGWGGWWFWDPVENASFMPWLIGAAFLHSVIVTEKRGGFSAWTALLAVLTFLFSILGAYLVRSGRVTSVHAFAVDEYRGTILLFGLGAYGVMALGLFVWGALRLSSGPAWKTTSREGALLANNVFLIVATLTVLLGTLYPLIAELFGRTMSLGEPYYRMTFVPMLAILLIALPITQSWSWGKADLSSLWKWGSAAAALILFFALLGVGPLNISFGAGLGVALGSWLLGGAALEVWRRAKTGARLLKLPARVWAMTLAHAGLGLFVLGAVIETTKRYEATVSLPMGGSDTVAGWSLTLDDVSAVEGPNWYADRATLTARRGGTKTELSPMKRYYPAARMPTTETAIHKTGRGDLYVALGEMRDVEGEARWIFRVYYNPLIDLVYFGAIFIALGGALALVDRRRKKPEVAS